MTSDGQGNVKAGSRAVWKTPAGGTGARAGKTTRSADGTVQHTSGFEGSGPTGSATSSGSFTKNPDGTVAENRSTTVTNATTGDTYEGSTSYSRDTGLVHSGICTDASGNTIACPGR